MIAREKHIAEVACRSYHEESHEYFAFCQGANWADANPVMPDEENDTGNEYAYVVHMKAKCAELEAEVAALNAYSEKARSAYRTSVAEAVKAERFRIALAFQKNCVNKGVFVEIPKQVFEEVVINPPREHGDE